MQDQAPAQAAATRHESFETGPLRQSHPESPSPIARVEARAAMRKLSPIEMMVDKACGFDRAAFEKSLVTLKCLVCKREKRVEREKTDPRGAAAIELCC